jgi:hypothetical protein
MGRMLEKPKIPLRPNGQPPSWTREKYPEMEKDIAEYLYAVAFYELWDGKLDALDTTGALARAQAEARFKALVHTFDLSSAFERTKLWQAYQFKKYQWGLLLPAELSSVQELMYAIRDDMDPKDTRRGQITFLADVVLPALEKNGIPIEKICCVPDNYSKAIEAAPRLRQLLERDKTQEAAEIIARVVDEKETEGSIREWLNGNDKAVLEKVPLETYLRPDGGELAVLRLPTAAHKRLVQMALKSILDGEQVHASIALAQELSEEIMSSRAGRVRP